MAIINVDDAHILNETGAQVDKTTGIPFKNESLTEAEAAQARANIRAGGSNRNLLDNWYFVGGGSQLGDGVFPINQRGQTSYSGGVQLDRWTTDNGLTLASDGITVSTGALYQNNWSPLTKALLGKTLTASVLFADGTIESGTATWPTTVPSELTFLYYPNNNIQLVTVFFVDGTTQLFRVVPNGRKVAAVKLELGTVSTLANDVPPDFGEELRKCQRRLFIHDFANGEIIANGFAVSANYSVLSLPLPVSMASDGSLTGTVTANPLIYGGGTGEQVSSFSVSAVNGNYAKIGVATTVMPSNNSVTLYANTNIRLTISRES